MQGTQPGMSFEAVARAIETTPDLRASGAEI